MIVPLSRWELLPPPSLFIWPKGTFRWVRETEDATNPFFSFLFFSFDLPAREKKKKNGHEKEEEEKEEESLPISVCGHFKGNKGAGEKYGIQQN